ELTQRDELGLRRQPGERPGHDQLGRVGSAVAGLVPATGPTRAGATRTGVGAADLVGSGGRLGTIPGPLGHPATVADDTTGVGTVTWSEMSPRRSQQADRDQ